MTLAFDVEEQIEEGYLQRDWRLFYPEQFGEETEALEALLLLAKQGKLVARVDVRCNEGHTVWSDEITPGQQLPTLGCTECEEAGNVGRDVFARFSLGERWRAKLDKKKVLRTVKRPPYP